MINPYSKDAQKALRDAKPKTQLMRQFLPILDKDYTYYVYYGGRGGGKTENIAIASIIFALRNPRVNILCVREVLDSIADSVKAMITKWIENMGLENEFHITRDKITCNNGTQFIFKGLRDHSADAIKSIVNVKFCWIEEAASITYNSWIKLNQTIQRYDPKVVISFNPEHDFDCIYDYFIVKTPPPNTLICRVNYSDNPFFKGSPHEKLMLHEKATMSVADFEHFWEGEVISKTATALWNREGIDKMQTNDLYERANYTKIIIACDPATTSHLYSNEYGIIVAGLRRNSQIDIIADFGGIYTPFDFGERVAKLWKEYQADSIVVEGNQGGEHLKQTILTFAPTALYESVWSSVDKIARAAPVASLCTTGRIKHLKNHSDFNALELQLRQMTTEGYIGPKGSSPDRVDAYVWAVSNLAGLKGLGTEGAVFTPDMFVRNDFYTFKELEKLAIVAISGLEATLLEYEIWNNQQCDLTIIIKDCIIDDPKHIESFIQEHDYNGVLIPDIQATTNWHLPIGTYYETTRLSNLDELVLSVLGTLRANKVQFDIMPHRHFNTLNGELLRLRTGQYYLDGDHHTDSATLALAELTSYYFD